jgi:uncharacterized protein (TIGR02231 family)
MDIHVESQVTAVTVYPDRARITLAGQCQLEAGLHTLLVGELPLTLESESLRAAGSGSARVRLLSVDVAQRHYEQTPATVTRELEQQIEQVEDELRLLQDGQAGLEARARYLDGLRQATVQYARGLARGQTTVDDQARLTHFLQEQDTEVRAGLRELDRERRQVNRRLDQLRRQLAAAHSTRPRQRYEARVEVDVLAPGDFELALLYVVRQAGWQPLYDLRLVENEDRLGDGSLSDGRALEVNYLAQVTQNSGQDWRGVRLALSTARPALNRHLPELKPWFVDAFVPQPMARSAVAPASARMDKVGALPPPQAAPLIEAEIAEAEVAYAEISVSDTAIAYNVGGRSDIPSDGSPHKVTIDRFHLTPKLDFVAVPKETAAVYRRVTVINDRPAPLLAGKGNLFAGDEFIGTNQLEYTPSGGEVELLLGVEERITIERELARRDVDKTLLRDRRQLRYGYKIEVHNLLPSEAVVTVHDHIPVSRNEQIKIRLEKVSPDAVEKSELNLIKWCLTLAPGARQLIQYEYLVEHPRSLVVSGLLD